MTSEPSWPARAREAFAAGRAATARLRGHDLGLLGLRLWLAQEFGQAGWTKLSGGWGAPEWFAGIAFPGPLGWLPPDLNWAAAGVAEVLGGAALLLGWPLRLGSLALLFVTGVAVYAVHFELGWSGWNQIETPDGQGFKLPLMIALMLFALLDQGPGRWAWRGPLR